VLVGHSYGGAVMTCASSNAPNVKALVYVASFGLDRGASANKSVADYPPPEQAGHAHGRREVGIDDARAPQSHPARAALRSFESPMPRSGGVLSFSGRPQDD
jgi:pimeloyl-ACP methyl ester carboxylesterase